METVLTGIPFRIDPDELARELRISIDEDLTGLRSLAAGAQACGRPKAMFKTAFIEERGEDSVVVEGIKFASRVLRVNMERAFKVLPYLATCGAELGQWSESITDPLVRYWADKIMERALHAACQALDERLRLELPVKSACMNPGSLPDWPL